MNKFNQKLETAANILIVIVTFLFIGILAKQYLFSSPTNNSQMPRLQPTIGKKITLENIDFSEQSKTVVVALQTTCHFCNESAPFYKKMLAETKGKNIKFVAVFPTKVEDSQNHLAQLGITGFEVKQVPISQLETSGTPTLIITNSKGEIEKFWIGKLSQDKEMEVINYLNS